jgi:hypothetical protein
MPLGLTDKSSSTKRLETNEGSTKNKINNDIKLFEKPYHGPIRQPLSVKMAKSKSLKRFGTEHLAKRKPKVFKPKTGDAFPHLRKVTINN